MSDSNQGPSDANTVHREHPDFAKVGSELDPDRGSDHNRDHASVGATSAVGARGAEGGQSHQGLMADDHVRIKKLHFSPRSRRLIVCGVARNAKRSRTHFTATRADVTCKNCLAVLDAQERRSGVAEAEPEPSQATMDKAKRMAARFYRGSFEALFRTIGAERGKCKRCGRHIWWLTTKNGARAPFTIDGQNHAGCPAKENR